MKKIDTATNTTNFINEIERLVQDNRFEYFDAVVYYCKKQNIEIETAASIIKSSPKFKQRFADEAKLLNLLK